MIENKSAMTPADAGPVHCPVGRLPVKTEPLFAKLIEALSSRHTYTEAEVRLVMLGMQAEIDRANDARRQAQAENAELKERMARVRLELQREMQEQGWVPPNVGIEPHLPAQGER
jgi:hypothetical protein